MAICAGKSPRPRGQAAHLIPKSARGARPIQEPVFLGDFARISGARLILGLGLNFSFHVVRDRGGQQFGPQCGQAIVERGGIVAITNGSGAIGQHGSGIQAGVHLHDRDASFGFALEQSPLNGRGAAIFRKKRGVDIKTAEARQVENCSRQNLTVGGDNDQVRGERAQLADKSFFTRFEGLENRQAKFQGPLFDSGKLQPKVAAFGAIRLSDHGDDFEIRRRSERFKTGARQRGCSHEDYS